MVKFIKMKNTLKHIIKNTFNFSGITTRKEYWSYFFIIIILVKFIVLSLVFGIFEAHYLKVNNIKPNGLMFRNERAIINIILVLPLVSGTVRRLRDAGFSVWLLFIPVLNLILCMYPTKKLT